MKTILLFELFVAIQVFVIIFIYEIIWREIQDRRKKRKDAAKNKS
jgi:TM2 domain-containing membrane protein YozV